MKNIYLPLILSLFLAGSFLSGCKKDDPNVYPEKSGQTDQEGSAAIDEGIDDINDIINNKIGGGSSSSKISAYNLPCGVVSIDSSATNDTGAKIYVVKYGSQTPCGYKKKSGETSFSLSNGSFNSIGAVYTIKFTDYIVEVLATGNTVIINGTLTVTNVDGGYVWQAAIENATINHRIRGTLNISYSNGGIRSRSYYKLKTWTSGNGWAGLSLTVTGDTLINSLKVMETGQTVEGNYDFKTEILQDFIWSNCGTTYAGPYVLKVGKGRMNITVPNVSPAYFDIEAGYYIDPSNTQATPSLTNNCESNSYKITSQLGTTTNTKYQLY